MKNATITIAIGCMAVILSVSPVRAEMVTLVEALTVADNWVTLIIRKEGDWGGSDWAHVDGIEEFTCGGRLLGYFCYVKPKGFIVVSSHKELAPVNAYSATCDLDPESNVDMVDFVKSGMERALDRTEQQTGPIVSAQAQEVQGISETDQRLTWEKLGSDVYAFGAELEVGLIAMNYVAGQVLLSSNWHQGDPYNRQCPAVYEWTMLGGVPKQGKKLCDHAPVGCVALAGAQIMRYWAWPPSGVGHDGDVHYDDEYNWVNMPDTLTIDSPGVQIDAVAELCREVGRATGVSYGCDGSTAWCGDNPVGKDMAEAYEDHFRYSRGALFDLRALESQASWRDKIKRSLNQNRPLQYCTCEVDFPGVVGHSMVCDGWKQVGGTFYCHMNDGNLAWVDVTNLPGAEGVIRGIRPSVALGNRLENKVYPATLRTMIAPGVYGPEEPAAHYFDQDCTGDDVTFEPGHSHLQFLPGITVTGTSPVDRSIRFQGSRSDNTRLFSIEGTESGGMVAGIRIRNGAIRLNPGGSLRFH